MNSRLWIPGGTGMLGARLAADAIATHEVVTTGHEHDIADAAAVARFLDERGPFDVVVNCAAFTAVDLAETERDAAMRVNAVGPAVLAQACAARGIRLVHVSTDYVFSGSGDRPLREDDATGPTGAYGASKLAGEGPVVDAGGLVVRTSWLYGPTHKNFVLTMLRLMADRELLRVVADQRGRPTSTATLSHGILKLIDAGAAGVVHVADETGPAGVSWHELAIAILDGARARGLPLKATTVEAIPTSAYPTPAQRPAWSVFDTARYTALTGEALPDWRTRLHETLDVVASR